jgi:uncharacterized protein
LVNGKFELVVSQDILLEYEEIIQIKYGVDTASSFMSLLTVMPIFTTFIRFMNGT